MKLRIKNEKLRIEKKNNRNDATQLRIKNEKLRIEKTAHGKNRMTRNFIN
jgi:hypothetical protein